MQAWVLLGQIYDQDHNYLTINVWVVGVYPDKMAAEAALAEIVPLAEQVGRITARCRHEAFLSPLTEKLTEAAHALTEADPQSTQLIGTNATAYHYRVLPGTWRQHF